MHLVILMHEEVVQTHVIIQYFQFSVKSESVGLNPNFRRLWKQSQKHFFLSLSLSFGVCCETLRMDFCTKKKKKNWTRAALHVARPVHPGARMDGVK